MSAKRGASFGRAPLLSPIAAGRMRTNAARRGLARGAASSSQCGVRRHGANIWRTFVPHHEFIHAGKALGVAEGSNMPISVAVSGRSRFVWPVLTWYRLERRGD